jgi:hypothetical protein
MNVRKFLAAQRAASRAGVMTAVLFFFGAIAGCSSTVSDEDIERGIAHPAQDAATIAEARAIDLRDEINRLKREEDELKEKRSDCLKQASYYLTKSAAVWSDPSVSEKERPARAGQFSTLADEKQAQADRYEQMVEACACRIASLEAERENQLKRAEDYKSQAIPGPSSE